LLGRFPLAARRQESYQLTHVARPDHGQSGTVSCSDVVLAVLRVKSSWAFSDSRHASKERHSDSRYRSPPHNTTITAQTTTTMTALHQGQQRTAVTWRGLIVRRLVNLPRHHVLTPASLDAPPHLRKRVAAILTLVVVQAVGAVDHAIAVDGGGSGNPQGP